MRINQTKQLLKAGKVALGCGQNTFRSAEIPKMFAAAGLDWIFIDTEHGSFTVETVQDLVRSSLLATITPIVRVADLQYSLVARAFDMGAEGIIFPRVESPELLEKAVSWTKFPPQGVRGYGLAAPHVGYQDASFGEIIEHFNEQTLVVVQVETQAALDCLDELAAVPGVDALLIGPSDLSISLGVAGQIDHPKMVKAMLQVIETCARHHRAPGIQVRNPADAKVAIERGLKLVGCSNEIGLLWGAVRGLAKDLKAARGQ